MQPYGEQFNRAGTISNCLPGITAYSFSPQLEQDALCHIPKKCNQEDISPLCALDSLSPKLSLWHAVEIPEKKLLFKASQN